MRLHGTRERKISDCEGFIQSEIGNINGDGFRQILGQALDFNIMKMLFQNATLLHPSGFAGKKDSNSGNNFRVFGDFKEVNVYDKISQTVVLHFLEKNSLRANGFNRQFNDDVLGNTTSQNGGEFLGIDLKIHVFLACTVHDGGDKTLSTELIELSGSGASSFFSFESVRRSHSKGTSM